ncbi:MAG: hypothetical protein K2X29_15010, partial [Candidatus Obscuribacterales bacterium]|nr:hypothetical protein [Candidatus Obscuribacterales bacterium]
PIPQKQVETPKVLTCGETYSLEALLLGMSVEGRSLSFYIKLLLRASFLLHALALEYNCPFRLSIRLFIERQIQLRYN